MTAEPNWVEVGRRIRKACADKGFVHHWQLAEAIRRPNDPRRVPDGTISRWLSGKQPPRRYLPRIAQALGVSQDWLSWGDAGQPTQDDLPADAVSQAVALLAREGYRVSPPTRPAPAVSGVEALESSRRRRTRQVGKSATRRTR